VSEKQTIDAQDVLRWIRHGFAAYLIAWGCASWASSYQRLPTNAIFDIADTFNLSAHVFLSLMFVTPGLLLLGPRTRPLGLWLALINMCTYELGLIVSAAEGTGTFTAPVTFGFVSIWAALLVSLRKVRSEPWPIQ
jgi:hypothetical protein